LVKVMKLLRLKLKQQADLNHCRISLNTITLKNHWHAT
jgi:hypothetical protein